MAHFEIVAPGLLSAKLVLHAHTKSVQVGLRRGSTFVRRPVGEAQERLSQGHVAGGKPGADERLPLPRRARLLNGRDSVAGILAGKIESVIAGECLERRDE